MTLTNELRSEMGVEAFVESATISVHKLFDVRLSVLETVETFATCSPRSRDHEAWEAFDQSRGTVVKLPVVVHEVRVQSRKILAEHGVDRCVQ